MSALDALLGDPEVQEITHTVLAPGELVLPVDHLSPSSIETFWKCPEQWRREKVLKERQPSSAATIYGAAFHRAAEHNMSQKIESHTDLPVDVMRDVTGQSFTDVFEQEKGVNEIDWQEANPNTVQQGVIEAMVGTTSQPGYHSVLAPTIQPVTVERTFLIDTPAGVPLTGRIDTETAVSVIDYKTASKSKTQDDLDASVQATSYLWVKTQEGSDVTDFRWHCSIKTKVPKCQELLTTRTAKQLELFEKRVQMTAGLIHAYQRDYGLDGPWPGATSIAWFCSRRWCGFWSTCPWGGMS